MKSNVFKSHAILAIAAIFLFTGSMANAAPKGKIEICHKPGEHNQKILSISPSGVAGHERHGDYLVTSEVCDGLDSDCDNPRVADNDVDCSDGIDCTVDSCGGLLGCDNIPDDSFCDDGDLATLDMCDVPTGGCVNTIIQVCGNGIRETPEECDDGNTAPGDGCSDVCTLPVCGDGILDPLEECDDSNTVSDDGCSAVCFLEFCGDNIVQTSEQCDDGNAINGDGCSDSCVVEEELLTCPCWNTFTESGLAAWLEAQATSPLQPNSFCSLASNFPRAVLDSFILVEAVGGVCGYCIGPDEGLNLEPSAADNCVAEASGVIQLVTWCSN